MNYIVLYADDFDNDTWEQYCNICNASYNSSYIKIEFNNEDVECGE